MAVNGEAPRRAPNQDEDNVQKTRKRSESTSSLPSRPNRRQVIQLPEVVSADILGTLLDEDIITRFRALDEDRNKADEASLDTSPWEVEIAYVRREQQMRRNRRETHAAWVKSEQMAFDSLEESLPKGDFDNSEYVYAATGGRPRWN